MPTWGVHTGLQNTTTDELNSLWRQCTINVGAAVDEEALVSQHGDAAEFVLPGVLVGAPEQMPDQVGSCTDMGLDPIDIAMRAPWDLSILDHVAHVMAATR